MSTKAEALRNPSSCLNKAAPEEPIFVLRANDPTAAQVIRLWAAMNDRLQPPEKVVGAMVVADSFANYNSLHCAQSTGEGYPSALAPVPSITPACVNNGSGGIGGGRFGNR